MLTPRYKLRREQLIASSLDEIFAFFADAGHSIIRQTAIFDPIGVLGLAYWYLVYPLH